MSLGSLIGPLLFNAFVNDILLCVRCTSIFNYANHTTIFACHQTFERFETYVTLVAKCFLDNYLKLDTDKCHLMILVINTLKQQLQLETHQLMKVSMYEKLLGITFDKKLSFRKHAVDLCKKANQKLHELARLSTYTDCPLVWMLHDRVLN